MCCLIFWNERWWLFNNFIDLEKFVFSCKESTKILYQSLQHASHIKGRNLKKTLNPSRPNPGRRELFQVKFLFQYNFQKCTWREGLRSYNQVPEAKILFQKHHPISAFKKQLPGKNLRWKAKSERPLAVCRTIYKNDSLPRTP